jgi:hypothetical protein
MNRSLRTLSVAVALLVCSSAAYARSQYCGAEEYAVNYSKRQVDIAQTQLQQQQNAVIRMQNQIDNRILALQLQVDQANAWRQSAAGLAGGSAAGCAIRTIFWRGGGRCIANSVAQSIRFRARANAQYSLAVNRLNTYQNSSATQLARVQQREALAQLRYNDAITRFKVSEEAYLECEAAQRVS